MTDKSIGFIGGGRVATIMLHGWKRAGQFPSSVFVTDTNAETLHALQQEFKDIGTSENAVQRAAGCDIVIIGLHPPVVADVLKEITPVLRPSAIVVSLAPKISIAKISELTGGLKNIVRVIPNAPSIINAGYNPAAFSPGISDAAKGSVHDLFLPLGDMPEVDEELLEAYAIFTAMGPTYLWFQLYELIDVMKNFGISLQAIEEGMPKMVNGAVRMMFESKLPPSDVLNLIPVKPLAEDESAIKGYYQQRLNALYHKLKS